MGLYSEACFYALRGHKGQIVQTGIHAVNIIIMKLLKNPAFVAVLLTSLLLTTNSQITDGLFSENPTGIINFGNLGRQEGGFFGFPVAAGDPAQTVGIFQPDPNQAPILVVTRPDTLNEISPAAALAQANANFNAINQLNTNIVDFDQRALTLASLNGQLANPVTNPRMNRVTGNQNTLINGSFAGVAGNGNTLVGTAGNTIAGSNNTNVLSVLATTIGNFNNQVNTSDTDILGDGNTVNNGVRVGVNGNGNNVINGTNTLVDGDGNNVANVDATIVAGDNSNINGGFGRFFFGNENNFGNQEELTGLVQANAGTQGVLTAINTFLGGAA